MTINININGKMCKDFFKAVDIRSSNEAIEEFRKRLKVAGLEIAKSAADNAKSRNRKTVDKSDFNNKSLPVKIDELDEEVALDKEFGEEEAEEEEE